MNKKLIYSRPEVEIVELTTEGVMAQSGPQIDRETTHGGGTSRSRRFWGDAE